MFGRKLRSPEAIRRRRNIRIIYASLALVALVFLMGLLSWASRIESLTITEVTVQGASVVDEKKLANFTLGVLEGNRFGLLSRRNILIYPKRSLRHQILTTYPRIAEVEIERDSNRTLRVTIQERNPYALWCGDVVPVFDPTDFEEELTATEVATSTGTSTTQKPKTTPYGICYFMDKDAFIFAKAPLSGKVPFHRFYGAIGKGRVNGQQFIEAGEFEKLNAFMSALKQDTLHARALLLIDEEEMELYLGKGPRVILRRDGDLDQARKNLSLVLRSPEFEDKDMSTVEYIDVRFGNKVYFKEEGTEELTTE